MGFCTARATISQLVRLCDYTKSKGSICGILAFFTGSPFNMVSQNSCSLTDYLMRRYVCYLPLSEKHQGVEDIGTCQATRFTRELVEVPYYCT